MHWAVEQAANDLNCILIIKFPSGISMSLDKTDVEKIANLARLAVNESDIPNYAQDLTNIFDLVEELSNADTNDISPMAHPFDAHQRLRADVVSETNQRDLFQSIAPHTDSGVYLVPQVIE